MIIEMPELAREWETHERALRDSLSTIRGGWYASSDDLIGNHPSYHPAQSEEVKLEARQFVESKLEEITHAITTYRNALVVVDRLREQGAETAYWDYKYALIQARTAKGLN